MKFVTEKILLSVFAIFLSMNSWAQEACESDLSMIGYDLESLAELCVNEPDEAKLVLIDSTTPLHEKTKSRIRAYLNDPLLDFQETSVDVTFSMARFGEDPLGELPLETVCRPPQKVSRWFGNPGENQEMKEVYACAVEPVKLDRQSTSPGYLLGPMLDAITGAGQSQIIETVNHVFTNVRYGLATSEKRTFVLISDLIQNSARFNFYTECAGKGADGIPSCPSYQEYSQSDAKIAKYLKAVTPQLKPDDRIFIFQLNHLRGTTGTWGNTNLQKTTANGIRSAAVRKATWEAEKFWLTYFEAAGVDPNNIDYKFEEDL